MSVDFGGRNSYHVSGFPLQAWLIFPNVKWPPQLPLIPYPVWPFLGFYSHYCPIEGGYFSPCVHWNGCPLTQGFRLRTLISLCLGCTITSLIVVGNPVFLADVWQVFRDVGRMSEPSRRYRCHTLVPWGSPWDFPGVSDRLNNSRFSQPNPYLPPFILLIFVCSSQKCSNSGPL